MRKLVLPAVMLGAIWIFSCRKSITESPQDSTSVNNIPFPTSPELGCTVGPNYGDSILFLQPVSGDWVVSPINNPGPGEYLAWPNGLAIDSSTGAIDISQSQTGQRYMVGFIPTGSKDTCLHQLILGGSSYQDSIYLLTNGNDYSIPYYNADPNSPSPCAGGGCNFEALGLPLKIDNGSGIIDLQQSFADGIFGASPVDGETVTATIQYRLNDQSNHAKQQMQIQFIYYYSQSNIPPSLLNEIGSRRSNLYGGGLIAVNGFARPPLIVITRVTN